MKMTWIQSFLSAGVKALPCAVLLTAALAASPVQAAEPTADWSASFNGNTTTTGWITSWGGENGGSYSLSPNTQGYKIASGAHPWVDYQASRPFSIALYADVSSISLDGKKALLVALGNKGNHIALVKSADNTIQVVKTDSPVEGLAITDDSLSNAGAFNFIAFGTDESGSFLQLNDTKVTGAAIENPNTGLQLGSMFQGLDTSINVQAYGMILDEIRGYNKVLSDTELAALVDVFPVDKRSEGYTVMGYNYPVIFRGTTDATWDKVANWYTLLTEGVENVQTWTAWTPVEGKNKAPGLSGSDAWGATLVDGSLMASSITVNGDGYKKISVAANYEGWASKVGIANNVHVEMANLVKLQSDSDWRIDATSKLTINAFGDGNKGGTHNLYCYAEEGLVFTPNCGIAFNYYLGKKGSVIYGGALSGTQTIKAIELDLGDSSKGGVEVKMRKLIGFGSSTATFNVNGATVTGVKDDSVAATVTAMSAPVNVGDYTFVTEADGLYVKYMAYGNVTYTTVSATTTGDATLSSLNLTGDTMTIAEITVPDGATLTIDGTQTFAKLAILCEGSVAIVATTEALANISVIDATGVTGAATYNAGDWYSRIPFAKLVGFDKIRKTYEGDWTPGDVSTLAGYQLEIAKGMMVVNSTMTSVVAAAENPILVTGEGSILKFNASHNYDRMPQNGYIKATHGGMIDLVGVNLFNGDNGPHVVLDNGILRATATDGCHIKIQSVTMANGSKIELSRAASAHASEGLVIRPGEASKIRVTSGDNTIEYLENGSATNTLHFDVSTGGVIDVAAGATLDVKVAMKTSGPKITKTGDGQLFWNGSTANEIEIAAGEVVFNADATPTNAFSGSGKLVADDGATLDLTQASVTGCALVVRNNGTLVLTQAQVSATTVPAGCTIKVKCTSYDAVTLANVTLADDTASVYFILPNGREIKGTVNGSNITMDAQSVYTYTAGAENNWSTVANWKLNGAAVEAAPTGTLTAPVEVVLTGATTLTMDVANVKVPGLSVSGGELTIAGANALTTSTLVTSNKVIVNGALTIDAGGTEEHPTEVTNVIEVANGGTLTTKGYLKLVSNNVVLGTLTAEEGETTINHISGSWNGGLQGTINVNSNAKLAFTGSDIVNWNSGDTAPLTINVKGELALGTTRMGLSKKTVNLYAGATVSGEGDGSGALDYFGDGIVSEINVLADGENTAEVTISAKMRTRDGAAPTFNVAEGMQVLVSGQIFGNAKIVATGAGTVKLTGTNTYTGGTTIDAGATIEATTIDNFSTSGNINVAGRVRFVPGSDLDQHATTAYGTADAPRLVGTGVVEFAGNGYYILPAGFTTPLAFENNRAGGIMIPGAPGITIGTLSGTGYFRADDGDNGEGTRIITVKQSQASTFMGYVTTDDATTRAVTLLVTKAEGVAEDVDTTLTLTGDTTAAGTTLSVAEGATVKLTGSWTQAINGAGTLIASGKVPTCTGFSAETWTGTVKLDAMTSIADLNLANYGNAASKIVLGNLGASNGNLYFANTTAEVLSDVEVAGMVIFRNGYSAAAVNFKGALTGNGTLSFPDASRSFGTLKFYGDVSGFTGTINCPARTSDGATGKIVFCTESSTTAVTDCISGITVADNCVLTLNATYTAPMKVLGTLKTGTINTLGGALTIGAGATLDVMAGALTAETLNTLPSSMTVKATTVPTLAADRVTLLKVKTLPTELASTLVTLVVNGENMGAAYELTTGEADANGYVPLQLKALVAAKVYPVETKDYPSLSAALDAGLEGEGPFAEEGPTNPMSIIVDFGDAPADGEPTPGVFAFDRALEFTKIVVQGTNGGTITATAEVMVTDVEVTEGVACTMDAVLVEEAARIALKDGAVLTLSYKDTDECSIAAVISGAGQLAIDGTVQLTGANLYTGGTVIPEGATLVAATNSLGTGAVTGAGKLVMAGYPEAAAVRTSLGDGAAWTGLYVNTADMPTIADAADWFGSVGNANSTVEFAGTSAGYFKAAGHADFDWIVSGSMTFNNGSSRDGGYTFNGALLGDGTIATVNGQTDVLKFLGETKDFAGTITVGGGHCIAFGDQADDDSKQGRLIIKAGKTANIAAGKTWSAVNGIEVEGTLGGTGAIAGTLIVAEGATLTATADSALTLAAGATLSLPTAFNVTLPEGTPLAAGVPVVILNRVDTTDLSIAGSTATVRVGEDVIDEAVLAISATGDVVVQIPAAFEAVVPVGETAWEDLDWTVAGVAVESVPGEVDNVVLKPEAAGAVVTCATAPLKVYSLDATGNVAIRFTRDCITQAIYESIPTRVTLVTTVGGLDEAVAVQLASLKYGAMATVAQTATSAVATLTLPDSAKTGEKIFSDVIAVSFGSGNRQIADTDAAGFGDYVTLGRNWTKVTDGAQGSTFTKNLSMVSYADRNSDNIALTTLADALTVNTGSGDVYWEAPNSPFSLLKGYIDDGGNRSFNLRLPEEKLLGGYTVVIYAAADTGNVQFAHFTVNGTNYTAVDGKTAVGNGNWGSAGAGNTSADTLEEGTNLLVIEGQTASTLTITEHGAGGGARGGIAGIQVIFAKDVYNLVSSVTATVSAATADTVVAWGDLNWVDDDGDPASAPTANTPATIVFESDATLDLVGATAQQVQVLGYGHRVRFVPESIPATVPFTFSEDTLYRLATAEDALPANVLRYPATLRYEYHHNASTTAYATIPETTSDFTAGFTGTFTANGGTIRFSDGVVTLPNLAGTGTKTNIVFAGTSRTTVEDIMALGETEAVLCDTASVKTTRLSLSDGQPGYTTFLTLEDSAQLMVTGTTNVDANTASIMIGHWNGPSTLTLRDNAKLIAEGTDLLVGKTSNTQTIVMEGGEMRVRGIKLSASAGGTNTLSLNGGKLLVGSTGISRYGTTTLTMNCNGGSVGALADTVTLGADADAAIATLNGTPIFESAPTATLVLAQVEPFLAADEVVNRAGTLQVGDATVTTVSVEGGTLKVAGELTADAVTVADGGKIAFDAGLLTVGACTLGDSVTVEIPVTNRLSDGGYIRMSNGAALPDLSGTILSLVLNETRSDAEKVLPEVPVVLGAYTDGAEPTVKGLGLMNNTNNAIGDTELVLQQGDLGAGLYVLLTGNEVLKRHDVVLNQTAEGTGYQLTQTVADSYPYYYFTATEEGARVVMPAEGVAVSHPTFSGKTTRIVVSGQKMVTPLVANHVSIAANLVFDLSAWETVLPAFVRGAVRDVPASFCLISGGVTQAEGVTYTVDMGEFELPAGFVASVEATKDGLYLVVSADRPAHTVSVNFTNAATPLVAPPAKVGVYATAVGAWNDLNAVYSSANLKVTDFGGEPSSIATSVDGSEKTRLLVYTSKVNTLADAPTAMLKVWLSDASEQTIQVQNVPFEAYRVALIFANDLEAAAYAPIQVGEGTYAMDGEGYTRRDITTYTATHGSTGLTTLEIAGDEAWGSTDLPEAAEPIVLGTNALVTDVLTDANVKITLPAAVYGRRYAGLAAVQIVEAPQLAALGADATFSYTFTADGEVALKDLDLTTADGTGTWVSATNHSLALTSDYDVTVTLPLDFVADTITLAGSGKITLKMENDGGALFNTLDASALTGDLTMHIACEGITFSAPAGVTTFEKAFNNNGQSYTIAAGATLVLGETSGITTNLDNVTSPMLTLANTSAGTLRRNYPVRVNGTYSWEDITLAFKDGIRSQNPDNSSSHLLVEAGDVYRQTGRLHLSTSKDWRYTQTGGSASFENDMASEGGMLLFNNASAEGKTATVSVTGGRLYATKISAWRNNSIANLTVSGSGTLALGSEGLRAQNAGARVNATFNDKGTLELAAAQLGVHNADRVSVTFNGGVITTLQSEATMNLPVAFAGTTQLAPAEGCTLVLAATNTGSGALEVTRGTVAITNAAALASTSTTVKSGATFEARGFAADATMSNTVTFEAGSILSATAAEGVTTVRIAGTLVMPANQTDVQYRLNGELYDGVTVNTTAGTVTFTTKVAVENVTWDATQSTGLWGEGVSGPWVGDATYYNGAAVTFVNATASKVDVTIQGNVAPASVTWGASSDDTYRFNAASDLAWLTLTGATLDMGAGQVYNVPVATAENVVLDGANNTYRLIGALSNGRKSASLVKMPSANDNTINRETTNHGVWCTDGVTLAPQPGEVMTLSAMGYAGETTRVSHLSGSGNVTITGGGQVNFAGRVIETSDNTVAYQNKAFSGQIIIQDGSTLDITMTRDRNDSRPRDDQAFFALPANGNQDVAGAPLWTGDTVGIRVLDGSTFRVSGCRGIFGGWANRNDANLLAARPLEIGTNATAEFAFSALQQVFPHGFRFTGNGATLRATQNMYVSGGTTIEVAGIGDKGDRADPATDTAVDAEGNPVNADTYNKLTTGITAEIAGGETTGLVPWSQAATANDPMILSVGEGSTLNISANLINTNEGASRAGHTFKKVGMGAVRFMQALVDSETVIDVTEGVLGGKATFTSSGTTVTAAAGTVVEAGLSIPVLNLADNVTLAINPTGETMLHAGRLSFTSSGHYTITSVLPEAEIAEAEGLPPMKVVSWNTMRHADTVVFALDDTLTAKGYGLELRTDGLYLMKQVTYVRELTMTTAGKYRVVWDENNAWYRLDDPATLRNYDATEEEAVTALFLLPEVFADEAAKLPEITLILTHEVSFANVRFAVPVEEDGAVVFKTLPVSVVYEYNLTNETMPSADSAKRFTWVPSLVLMREGLPGMASLTVAVPQGYEYTVSNTTVMVYASAAEPALNINFTEGVDGEASWIVNTADPCGVVPFAGVYWNNASTTTGNFMEQDANHTVMNVTALPAGIAADANGQVPACEVTYAFKQAQTVASRMSGNTDAALVASFLAGNGAAGLSEKIRVAGNMTDAGTQNGWQVRVASVPFDAYDLYLVLAGTSEDTVTYPAIRIKVGEGDWRTFSMMNGWTAPAARGSTWQGVGGLVKGEFVDGRNVLHIRVQATAGNALEIAPWDNGSTTSVGLAALQIVRCDDGAMMERLGDGKWSDAGGWRRTLLGGTEEGAWMDSTAEAPRYASIPMVQSLTADRVAAVPYLALTGSGSMVLKGSDAVLSTGALDLTQVDAGASLTFGADVFAEPINVLLAPDVTVCVPENDSGTVTNRWFWLNDDAARNMNSSSATIQKKLSGDVLFLNPVPFNLQIDDGTMWMAPKNNVDASGTVSGNGTFGKKGAGTLNHSGRFTLSGSNPLRISEGRLALTNALTGISGGATILIDGGTLDMPGQGGFTSGTVVELDRGTLIVKGTQRNNRPHVRLTNGSTLTKPNGDGGWQGYQLETLTVEGLNNIIDLASAGSGGPCIDVLSGFTVRSGATATIQGNGGALRICNGIVNVQDGATLTSKWRVGRGNADGYGAATDVLTKTGAGLWRIEQVLSAKGDSRWGQTFVVAEGEACFAFGGGNYAIEQSTPITIQGGAKLSGNVTFTNLSPVVFNEGAIVRSGVAGVATSKVAFHTVTFNKDMVFEFDLRNNAALTVTNAATFMPGEMTIRLLNMGDTFTGEKQLMAWPTSVSVPSTFTSPEAMALDAVLEKRADGLYLVASNASYLWSDKSGNWSDADAWSYQETAISYPEIAADDNATTPVARVVASTTDVALAVDQGELAAEEGIRSWKAKSLVTVAAKGRTLTLDQVLENGASADLYTVMAWSDIWKLGDGAAIFNAPVQVRGTGAGASLNVAGGSLTLTHPLTAAAPETNVSSVNFPATVEVSKGAALVYDLSATAETLAALNGKYNPLTQVLSGAVTGEGTLRVLGADNAITVTTTTDNNLNLDVQAGSLTLNGEVVRGASHSTLRTINVAKGAILDLASQTALGGSSNIEWTLAAAAEQGAIVRTADDARVRGQVNVVAAVGEQGVATLGTTRAALDGAMRVNVPANTVLAMGGEWTTPADAALTTALTKVGAGLLTLSDFAANVPVTVSAGEVRLGAGAVQTVDDNNGATTPNWTVAPGAVLTFGGGLFSLDNGSLTTQPGAILNGGVETTTVDAITTIDDRTIFAFGETSNINVGRIDFKLATTVNGVVTVNLDALSPTELVGKTSVTLMTFGSGMRSGSGSFQLGGNKLVAWAEAGWTLRDNDTEVTLQYFGGDSGYYTWAGDGSAGSTGVGNWANAFWVSSADPDEAVAWPTATDVAPSVKLQDTNPLTNEAIPEDARTLDWTLPEQTIANFYAKNGEEADYTLTSSNGSAKFVISGDFLKAGAGKLTVNRAVEFGKDGALRLLGGETEFTGNLLASSGDFKKPITIAGENTVLRFSGTSSYAFKGLLEGDGQGTLTHAGSGTLSISDSVDKLKAVNVESGHVRLLADDQYVVTPTIAVKDGATLTLGGTLSGSGAVQMKVNADTAPAGSLVWTAQTASSSDKAPRLAAVDGVTGAALKVDTFRYNPTAGHLIVDPNADALIPGVKLDMMAKTDDPTAALWLGAQATAGDAFTVSALMGTGVIGVEPVVELLADPTWSTHRVITVEPTETDIAKVSPFEGNFMGATTPDGTDIAIGLTVQNPMGGDRTYFRYMGVSTNPYLGSLMVGADATAEVTGTWAGDVKVGANGLLMGNGTVGAKNRTVSVPKGAIISGVTFGKRIHPNAPYTEEIIPAELKVKGTLSLEPGSVINTMIRKDEKGNTWASAITVENLLLPTVLEDGAEEVKVTVNVDLEEGAVVSNVKVLGWSSLNGGQKINGTVKVMKNGQEVPGYFLKKKTDGLYLSRESARFWMILH